MITLSVLYGRVQILIKSNFFNPGTSGIPLLYLLILFYTPIRSVEPPAEPQPPVVNTPQFQPESNKEKKGKKSIPIFLRLCDGREVSGNTEYAKDEIVFQHDKDGIKYNKKIYLQNIRQIFIKNFFPKQLKKTSNGTTFQFDPFDIEITTSDNDIYKLSGLNNTEFQKIVMTNQNGSTTLFTYWIDLQYDTGKWYSRLPTFRTSTREECHPDVVRLIRFEITESSKE